MPPGPACLPPLTEEEARAEGKQKIGLFSTPRHTSDMDNGPIFRPSALVRQRAAPRTLPWAPEACRGGASTRKRGMWSRRARPHMRLQAAERCRCCSQRWPMAVFRATAPGAPAVACPARAAPSRRAPTFKLNAMPVSQVEAVVADLSPHRHLLALGGDVRNIHPGAREKRGGWVRGARRVGGGHEAGLRSEAQEGGQVARGLHVVLAFGVLPLIAAVAGGG